MRRHGRGQGNQPRDMPGLPRLRSGAGAAADAHGCVRHHLSLRPLRRQGPHHQDPLYRLPGQRLRAHPNALPNTHMSTKRSKRYQEAAKLVIPNKNYSITEAVETMKSFPAPKFDPTVTVSFHLTVDPRKSDQMVRGSVSLPIGTGKNVRVLVFAQGDAAKAAQEAGTASPCRGRRSGSISTWATPPCGCWSGRSTVRADE